MKYEVQRSEENRGDYLVSAVDHENKGEIYLALFSGPKAKDRAEEYAAWKNSEADTPQVAPLSR